MPSASEVSLTPASFDWQLVRSFLAVLEAGSFTGAARAIGAHQPTLTRQVAELEAQLGTPLFERTGRGVVPTGAALAILESARRMQAGAVALSSAISGRRERLGGTVRITTSQVAAAYLLPPLLAELQAAEPSIELELVASNRVDNLLRRDADIAVRMVRPSQGSLVARRVADIPVGAYAHRSYLEAAGVPRTPAELLSHRLIGHDTDDLIVRGFASMGLPVSRERFAIRTDDHIAYGRLLADGAGIGFVASYNAAMWPGVVRVLPGLRIPPLPCWIAVHREIRGNRSVRHVFDFLAESLPRRLAQLEGWTRRDSGG
jgi:DNA-binding transcriptional LysR family regulator